jgi:hypothetical protein
LENPKLREYLERFDNDGQIILKLTLNKYNGRVKAEFIWLRTGKSGGWCEQCNDPLGFIKCEEFLVYLTNY